MNKEFEQEYKDYVNAEAPDLWNRIEAGLNEKENAKVSNAFVKKKKNASVFVSAAAAVLLCVFVPAALRGGKNADGTSANLETAVMESDAAFVESDGVVEDAGQEMDVSDSTGAGEGMDVSDSAGAGEKMDINGSAEAGQDMGVSDSPETSQNMNVNEGAENTAENLMQLTVCILYTKTAKPDTEYAYLYRAKVVSAAENPALEGTEIYFYAGEKTDITSGEMPEVGEEYEIDLRKMQGEEIFFAEKINFTP